MKRKRLLIGVLLAAVLLSAFLPSATAAAAVPAVSAPSYIVANADSGAILAAAGENAKIYPSSMVKLMTAVLVIENISDLDIVVRIPEEAVEGVSGPYVKAGENISIRDLLYIALLQSDNEACKALALNVDPTEAEFVKRMNDKAAALGMASTAYTNCYGGDDSEQYTTAADLLKLAQYALQSPVFVEISSTQYKYVPATNLTNNRYFYHNNFLIISNQAKKNANYYYKYANGVMSAYSSKAGYCVMGTARKSEMETICIVMGAEKDAVTKLNNAYIDARALFDWSFDNYKPVKLGKTGSPITEVPLKLAAGKETIVLAAAKDIVGVIPADMEESEIKLKFDTQKVYKAPITKGEMLGSVEYYYGDEILCASSDLVASEDISRNTFLFLLDGLLGFLTSKWLWGSLAVIALLVGIYIALTAAKNHRRHRRKKRYYKR